MNLQSFKNLFTFALLGRLRDKADKACRCWLSGPATTVKLNFPQAKVTIY